MKYKVNWGDGVFAVPDIAADSLRLASGKAVKVLLYILKNKISGIDPKEISKAAGVSEEDVEDAVSYWQQVGVLYADGTVPAETPHREDVKPSALTVSQADPLPLEQLERSIQMYTPEEIAERIENSGDINFLFNTAQSSLGKMLNYTEQRKLLWLTDNYGIAPDILLMIIDLAVQLNKANINYIEKIAISWHEKGIATHKQASEEIIAIQKYFSAEGQVKAKLGLDRSLTPTEKKFIKEWCEKDISIELIVYAYERTIDNIGKVKFSYMDKILSSWHEKGISTPAAARAEQTDPVQRKGTEKKQSEADNEHSYDLDLLIEHAMNNSPKIKKT